MRILLLLLLLISVPKLLSADAIIITRAMTAETIAEVFIEKEKIRLELEIGMNDIPSFKNLLPDDVYEKMNYQPRPLVERIEEFYKKDFVIYADGKPLQGTVIEMGPRNRIKRDEITGEPVQSDKNQLVVYAVFEYPLKKKPQTINLQPPLNKGYVQATIGFVTYHQGLAVNEFRYLGTTEVLHLDWDDPWYSAFENRNLKRQYREPVAAFIYVEPFEVRKEIIIRPRDLQQWVDLNLDGKEMILAEDQEKIKQTIVEYLNDKNPVFIDGKEVDLTLDRIHFIRRSLRMTSVIDPPEDLPLNTATLGIIYSIPVAGLPERVEMHWEMFNDRVQAVYASATDEAGGLPHLLRKDDSILVWQNFLKNPTIPKLVDIAPPKEPQKYFGFVNPFDQSSKVTLEDSQKVVLGLLKNIYHAFDFREESDTYDILERSVSGDLLTKIYLETRRSLKLKNQGGAEVKIKDVDITEMNTTNLKDEVGFTSRCVWDVAGSVGHWGHIHMRKNQYEAKFTVKPVDGVWKITELEILSEERI